MALSVVHNLDTEQTGSQIYDTQVLHASNAWLQGHMDQWHKLLGVPYTSFRAIPSVFPGAVVIVTKCGRIVRKVRLLVRFGSTALAPHFPHYALCHYGCDSLFSKDTTYCRAYSKTFLRLSGEY